MVSTLLTFDAGTPGNTVVAGANGIASITTGTQKYIAGFHGAAAVQAGLSTNTVDSKFKVSLGLNGNHYGSIYLRNNTAHGSGTASVNFFQLTSTTNEVIAQLRVRPSNALSIRVAGAVEVRTGTAGEIPVGAWFRLDWQQAGTTFNWRIFLTPEGTTPDLSGSVTTTATNPSDSLILGADSSSAIIKDWSFDTVRANDGAAWFGPYAQQPITRRNFATDPAATANASAAGILTWAPRFYGTGATGTTTLQTGTGPVTGVSTFMRKTWGSTVDSPDVGFQHTTDAGAYPVTPGDTYTISSYVRTNALRKQASMRPRYLDASHVRQSALDPASTWVPLTQNAWTRISVTVTIPAGVAYIAPWSDADNFSDTLWVSGNTFDGTALLVEKVSTLGAYFDGSTSTGNGATYEWEGSVNNSTSVQRGTVTPSGPTVKVWNGTAEVDATVTLWNGTSEVAIGSLAIA